MIAIPPETDRSEFESRVTQAMVREGVPGASIALIANAASVWTTELGFRSAETRKPVTADAEFAACSLSKPVAAYAALRLCERGSLALDTPLQAYLPRPFSSDDPRLAVVTLRMVLSHVSGLSHSLTPRMALSPGKRFSYSAGGFAYLQQVIESVTQLPFERFMDDEILRPLGMGSSSFGFPEEASAVAVGHDQNQRPLERTVQRVSAGGTLRTTARDYATFMMHAMAEARRPESGVREMFRAQVEVEASVSWGLGWGLQRIGKDQVYWHWGDDGGYRHFAVGCLKQETGMVILTNSKNGDRIFEDVLSATAGDSHPDIVSEAPCWEDEITKFHDRLVGPLSSDISKLLGRKVAFSSAWGTDIVALGAFLAAIESKPKPPRIYTFTMEPMKCTGLVVAFLQDSQAAEDRLCRCDEVALDALSALWQTKEIDIRDIERSSEVGATGIASPHQNVAIWGAKVVTGKDDTRAGGEVPSIMLCYPTRCLEAAEL